MISPDLCPVNWSLQEVQSHTQSTSHAKLDQSGSKWSHFGLKCINKGAYVTKRHESISKQKTQRCRKHRKQYVHFRIFNCFYWELIDPLWYIMLFRMFFHISPHFEIQIWSQHEWNLRRLWFCFFVQIKQPFCCQWVYQTYRNPWKTLIEWAASVIKKIVESACIFWYYQLSSSSSSSSKNRACLHVVVFVSLTNNIKHSSKLQFLIATKLGCVFLSLEWWVKLFTVKKKECIAHVFCLSQLDHRRTKQAVIEKGLKSCFCCAVTAVLYLKPNGLCQKHPLCICLRGRPLSNVATSGLGYLQTVLMEIQDICEWS